MSGIMVGVDPASHAVGVCVAELDDLAVLSLTTLRARGRDLDQRLDRLCELLAGVLGQHEPLVIAFEEPSDRFAGDRHDTPFILGRAFERLWSCARLTGADLVAVSPGAASVAVGCRVGSSKDARTTASARLIGAEWDSAKGAGTWRGQPIGPDALDAYAALCAGKGVWRANQLRALAGARSGSCSRGP